jgi:hypothetical protein
MANILSVAAHFERRRSSTPHVRGTEALDIEEMLGIVSDDIGHLKDHARRCAILVPIFRRLAVSLRAGELKVTADRMEKRIIEVERALSIYPELIKSTKKLEAQYDAFLKTANTNTSDADLLHEVTSLAAFQPALRMADELGRIFSVWEQEEEISADLEEYVSDKTGVGKKALKANLNPIFDESQFVDGAYGFLNYVMDVDITRDNIGAAS